MELSKKSKKEDLIKLKKYCLSMMVNPRATIRSIVNDKFKTSVAISFAILVGIIASFTYSIFESFGDTRTFSYIVPFSLIFGSFVGIISIYFFGGLLELTANWFGGTANSKDDRTAIIWGCIPFIMINTIVIILAISIFGIDIFTSQMSYVSSTHLLVGIYLIIFVAYIVGVVWSFFLILNTVSEVNDFSMGKGFISLILAGFLFTMICRLIFNLFF